MIGRRFGMTAEIRTTIASTLIVLACLVTSLPAQPAGADAIANYSGADRQAVLEAGARREGSVLVYTTGTQIKPLLDRFEQKYPFVKVELARASSADTARKVVEEYRAGYE
jgi:iron(III) transport system substrate-binding protein